ncbi:hypothetical protein [Arthrobacter alpinus]|nr:hypothetical protein [Arthrobacter alpinus]
MAARHQMLCGPARISHTTGVPERSMTRILGRHEEPLLAWFDPVTGELIRAQGASGRRYERDRAGELIHIDVKKVRPDSRRRRVEGPGPESDRGP